jgi:hypothetical protein
MPDDAKMISENAPEARDPRNQRRVVATWRPIAFVENMHDVVLECGHSPLVFGIPGPNPGDMLFCPDCYRCFQSEPMG